jgi:hypothetical protein
LPSKEENMMKLDVKGFGRAVAIRAVRTFAEGMLGALGTTAVGVTQVDWAGAASVGATAAVVSVLIAIATGLPEAENGLPEAEEAE